MMDWLLFLTIEAQIIFLAVVILSGRAEDPESEPGEAVDADIEFFNLERKD